MPKHSLNIGWQKQKFFIRPLDYLLTRALIGWMHFANCGLYLLKITAVVPVFLLGILIDRRPHILNTITAEAKLTALTFSYPAG